MHAGHPAQQQMSASSFNLYPETTISPMSGPPPPGGGHLRNLEPMQPMALKSVIKTEPVAYIKREDNNNAPNLMLLHPPPPHQHPHHHLLNTGYPLHTPGVSPISSMSSPGSPPNNEKSQVAMTIASLSNPWMGPSSGGGGHFDRPPLASSPQQQQQHMGGGKVRTPVASTSRKKPPPEPTAEEDELASI